MEINEFVLGGIDSAPRMSGAGGRRTTGRRTAGIAFVLAMAAVGPAAAQVSLVGEWSPRYHEDQPERIPGPELGDYTGLPFTDGARLAADSWDASRLTLP